ncbi:hypothetical protein E4U38_000221, partial [Claviceps purpurea]
ELENVALKQGLKYTRVSGGGGGATVINETSSQGATAIDKPSGQGATVVNKHS